MLGFAYRTLSALSPILGFLASLWLIYNVETRYFPVITDFQMEYVEKRDGSYVIGGTMRKARGCELLSVSIIGVRTGKAGIVLHQIKSEVLGGNMPTGLHTWGPWAVPIPPVFVQHLADFTHVEVRATHRCNPLWLQETHYTNVPLERLLP